MPLPDVLMQAVQTLAQAVQRLPGDDRYAPIRPRVLVVGGFVRDKLLGVDALDVDVEVYGVDPGVLRSLLEDLFGEVNLVGESFGIMKIPLGSGHDLDVSLPRKELSQGAGHRDFLIEVDPGLAVEQAARRRDFTMNALLYDPLTDEILDPFDGERDLRLGILRIIDPITFIEDPLRVLRAMQFVARFDLKLDPHSQELMRNMVTRQELANLSAERITDELAKLLLSPRPSLGLAVGRELGVVAEIFPELAATIGVAQEPQWHPEGDVWTHTLMVVDEAAKIVRRDEKYFDKRMKLQVMFGALCHDFGKPLVTRVIDGRIRALGHEEAGEAPVRSFCERLYFHHEVNQAAIVAATQHLKPGMLYRSLQSGEMQQQQYIRAVGRLMKRILPVSWRVLAACSEADMRGRGLPSMTAHEKDIAAVPSQFFGRSIASHNLVQTVFTPLILGRDLLKLGCPPGLRMGKILDDIEEARDEGLVCTREDALLYASKLIALSEQST